jgi:hypothetical protein
MLLLCTGKARYVQREAKNFTSASARRGAEDSKPASDLCVTPHLRNVGGVVSRSIPLVVHAKAVVLHMFNEVVLMVVAVLFRATTTFSFTPT